MKVGSSGMVALVFAQVREVSMEVSAAKSERVAVLPQ